MRKATSEEVRYLQLDLLNKLDSFCKEHNIQYYAFAGTLLGAVRHRGFIPWDNDIDVAVSRTDYKVFQVLLKDEVANDDFRFLCYENDRNYLWQHGRVVAKGTYLKTARGYDKLGLSIDIFPLDNQSDDEQEAEKNLLEIKKCVQLRIMSYDKKYKGHFTYPKCSEQEKQELYTLFELQGLDDEEYWVKRHISLAQKFSSMNGCKYFGCNSNDKYTVVCQRKWYESAELLPFENSVIPVPNGYKDILNRYYGDYMKLPDEDKRIGMKTMEVYLL